MPARRHPRHRPAHVSEHLEQRRLLAADVVVTGSNSINFDDDQTLNSLTLLDTSRATVLAGSPKFLGAGSLSIAPAARLDLKNNDLLIDYNGPSPFLTLRDYTLDARIGSSIGDGSQVLALFDNTLAGAAAWRERPIDASTVVGHFTWVGDVTLDDQVTGDDYTIIDSNLNTTPPPGDAWISGDANRDGVVTGDDYTIIDSNLHNGELPGPLRINAGGPALVDSLARRFDADAGFTGGATAATNGDVANTTDDGLFNTYRTGAHFTFDRAIPNGNYTLWLEFAEPTFTAPGQRSFDVFAEGSQILDDFDIFAAAGAAAHTAVARSFNVHVSDHQLNLSFDGVSGDAIVSAIVLAPDDPPPAMQAYSDLYLPEASKLIPAASNLRQINQGCLLYGNDHRGQFPPDLVTMYDEVFDTPEPLGGIRTSTLPPRGELSRLEQHAWVASLHDYIYLGAGKRFATVHADDVIVYENPDRVNGGINIGLGDGSVIFLDRAAAAQRIGFPNVPPSDPPPVLPPPALPTDARVLQSQSNLRQIGQAIQTYSTENKGTHPATFGPLAYQGIDPNAFIDRRTESAGPPPGMTLDETAAWINTTTDYIYRAGLKSGSPSDAVLAYENPHGITDGINILFNDGFVRFVELPWAREILARSGVTI